MESTDYARSEYGATQEEVQALEAATERRYETLRGSKKLVPVTADELRKMFG